MQHRLPASLHALLLTCFVSMTFFMGTLHAQEPRNTFHCTPSQTCVNFVLMNDVYQWRPYPAGSMGTMSRVFTYLKQTRATWPEAQLLFAGDLLSPSPESQVTKGRHMVSALNKLDVAAATLGNHEFDFGDEGLAAAIKLSAFPWLAGNVRVTNERQLKNEWIHPYHVLKQHGKRILVLGVLTPETLDINNVEGFLGIDAPIPYLQKHLDDWIKAESPDLVVALTHLNIAEDRALAQAFPQLDAIFGGHDHNKMLEVVNGVPIIKLDSDAKTIGHIQFNLPKVKPHVKRPFWRRQPSVDLTPVEEWHYNATALTPKRYPSDAAFEKNILWKHPSLNALDEPLGIIPTDWDLRQATVRGQHSLTAQRMAAIMREYGQADIAIINGGGIRGQRILPAGEVSKRDILQTLPFDNTPVIMDVTGAELQQLIETSLETSAKNPNWGGTLHVSGATVILEAKRPTQVVQLLEARSGTPLNADKTYRVLVNDYLAQGGNGYDLFKQVRDRSKANGRLKVYTKTQAEFLGKAIKALPIETLRRLSNEAPSVQYTLTSVD